MKIGDLLRKTSPKKNAISWRWYSIDRIPFGWINVIETEKCFIVTWVWYLIQFLHRLALRDFEIFSITLTMSIDGTSQPIDKETRQRQPRKKNERKKKWRVKCRKWGKFELSLNDLALHIHYFAEHLKLLPKALSDNNDVVCTEIDTVSL